MATQFVCDKCEEPIGMVDDAPPRAEVNVAVYTDIGTPENPTERSVRTTVAQYHLECANELGIKMPEPEPTTGG